MTVTTTGLTRAAAVSATAAGAIFIGVQIGHPHLDATSVQSTEVVVRSTLNVLMAQLAGAGISGMYIRKVRRNGVLGLVGWVLLSAGYLSIIRTGYVAAFLVAEIASSVPTYADGVIDVTTGRVGSADIGAMQTVNQVQGLLYLGGGLILGIALFRARILARWACLLLAAGGVITVALALMPDAFYRLLAYPNAVAMIGLGVSLWMSTRESTSVETAAAGPAPERTVAST